MPELLTSYEVSGLLALPAAKVERLARAGQIPCVIVVGEIRFDADQLREWLRDATAIRLPKMRTT